MTIVTVSRGTFSGGNYLAQSVASRLGYRCLSREELLVSAARRYTVPEYAFTAALDNKPGFPEGMNLKYICYVRAALAWEIRNDNVVYHGQMGHLLLKGVPNLLKVRVVALMEDRISAAMDQYQVGREAAIVLIRKLDSDRTQWIQAMYQADWEDPSQYDLVVDLGRMMSASEASDWIIKTVRADYKSTPESRKRLDDFVLESNVRARIASHKAINDHDIDVEANGGMITIKGKAESVGEAHRIVEVARQTPGVRDVESALRIWKAGVYVTG